MFETLVQLHSQGLQSHARLESVRALGSPAHLAVDLFFKIHQRLLHFYSLNDR